MDKHLKTIIYSEAFCDGSKYRFLAENKSLELHESSDAHGVDSTNSNYVKLRKSLFEACNDSINGTFSRFYNERR